ncbi:MAG: GTPase ObgE [Planctomycetota bacterium]|nr:GTPase ObgE [Planctomycetota bacterium]
MFVDRVEIDIVAGKGGDGCMSFRRERYVPKGGPDGGDGGNGGSVLIEAVDGINSLVALKHKRQWKAERGKHGSGSDRRGRNGTDITISVPPGTLLIDHQDGFVIKDLAAVGDSLVAARGGTGGRGNAHFKSSTNQAPREWTPGSEGESRRLILELKVIADVGLIGKPNAGKSTLLSRMSRAKPEIASYPFTTKFPNLGLVEVDIDRTFVLADIPGLIEGASEGVGLGHEFLKHIERAGILVHLVEPAPMDESDPLENYRLIRNELIQYKPELGHRPELVVVTKSELPGAEEISRRLEEATGQPVLLISAATGSRLDFLTGRIAEMLAEQNRA